MSDRDYTNGELGLLITNLAEQNEIQHNAIIKRLDHTNGSVASLKIWRGVMMGGLSVITAIIIPIMFMLINFWLDNLHNSVAIK